MLQIRLSLPEFSNGVNFSDPIIMENAENVTLVKTVNSSDENILFDLPINDPKMEYVNYLRWWECWDTVTNQRLNYGPIKEISRGSGDAKKIQGPGRSALLLDFFKSVQTFYYPLDRFLDDLRYENMAGQPRTSTIINQDTSSDYYGLSKRSKDRAIDEQTGYIAIGRDVPTQRTKKTDSFWSGTGKSDFLIVDLGDIYTIAKLKVLFPWWGGATINNNRAYDWKLYSSSDNITYTEEYSHIVGFASTNAASPFFDGDVLYWGESGFEWSQATIDFTTPITTRYFKFDILDTFARYNHNTATELINRTDEWDWECAGTNIFNGASRASPSVSTGDLIDKNEIVPSSDCHASIVEIGIFHKVIGRDAISKLTYHQIDGASRQITYYHVPDASEMLAAGGARKFEPGGFFRHLTITTSSDVTAIDEYNIPVYSGGSGTIRCSAYSRLLKFTGSGDVQVTYADTWPTLLDAYSYSGSYSFSSIANDYILLDFRGVSLKWYATIPSDKVPGTVSIELRSKDDFGVWGSWSVLESSFTMPANVAGEKVWEITYESNILSDNTSYQLRITNLDGNFVSVDSFAGYWSASFTDYNEDISRMGIRHTAEQFYDQRFSNGSIYEFTTRSAALSTQAFFEFEGDRIIVYGRKGPSYGKIKLFLLSGDIPGGSADGGLIIDLNSSQDISQSVLFDSAEYFVTDGLPWGRNQITVAWIGNTNPVWLDGMGVHETSGLTTKFINSSHLEILDSTAKALQMEWDVTELGLKVVPRLGIDTDVIFAEGRGTTIKVEDVQDVSQIASMLVVNGADIDGLPLSAVVEDKKTRREFNRTIQRLYDLRNVGDYFTLIGAARTELLRRKEPQKRITVTTTDLRGVTYGDSFIVKDAEIELRARAMTITRTQSTNAGTQYIIECLKWPQIT